MVRIITFIYAVAIGLALPVTTSTALIGAGADSNSGQKHSQSRYRVPVAGSVMLSTSVQAILWREPVDIERRDLFYGPGGRDNAPDPSYPFTFVRESAGGTQKKVIVKDQQGREWTVKFGPEARPETTATRILWAAGYFVDKTYFLPQARIVGKENINAYNVRFKLREKKYDTIGTWKWDENPFVGTRELEGLKVMMALLKNWDVKSINNEIMAPEKAPGPRIYYVSDLGATFGQSGTFVNSVPLLGDMPAELSFSPDKAKGDVEAFRDEKFIKEVRDGKVNFYWRRSSARSKLNGVPIECARWMGALLGRLSDKQLADAFCAGGFDQAETAIYVRTLRERINELQRL